jgi:hypothetical protein
MRRLKRLSRVGSHGRSVCPQMESVSFEAGTVITVDIANFYSVSS